MSNLIICLANKVYDLVTMCLRMCLRIKAYCFLIFLWLVVSTAKAEMMPDRWCPTSWCGPCAFWGADFKYGIMHGIRDWKPEFPKEYLGGNIYFGLAFHPNFGISAGYERTVQAFVHRRFGTFFLHDLSGVAYNRSLILRTFHLDLEYYFPILCAIQGVISIGGGYINPKLHTTAAVGPTSDIQTALVNLHLSKPGVFRARLGGQWQVYDFLWLRGLLGFDNTARLRVVRDSARIFTTNNISIRPLSDMFSVSLGFMIKFGI